MYKGKIILFIAVIFIVFCMYLIIRKILTIKGKRNKDNSDSIVDEEDSIF